MPVVIIGRQARTRAAAAPGGSTHGQGNGGCLAATVFGRRYSIGVGTGCGGGVDGNGLPVLADAVARPLVAYAAAGAARAGRRQRNGGIGWWIGVGGGGRHGIITVGVTASGDDTGGAVAHAIVSIRHAGLCPQMDCEQ